MLFKSFVVRDPNEYFPPLSCSIEYWFENNGIKATMQPSVTKSVRYREGQIVTLRVLLKPIQRKQTIITLEE